MMCPANRCENLLSSFALKYRKGDWLSHEELELLLKLCTHPEESLRERALTLLLDPPVSRELAYHERLIHHLSAHTRRVDRLPLPLVELLCDGLAFTGRIPSDPLSKGFFVQLLKKLSKGSVETLFEKSYSLRPFLAHLPVRALLPPQRDRSLSSKARWRLLRSRLLSLTSSPPWAEVTMRDLKLIRKPGRAGLRCFSFRGRWLALGRALLSPPRLPPAPATPCPLTHSYWGGAGNLTLHYFESLLRIQAEELGSVRQTAREVSQSTRRVVLSWHNASLAAAGGWAFENLSGMFPSPALYRAFQKGVERRIAEMEGEARGNDEGLQGLWSLWEERMVAPRIAHALWESRIRASLDSSCQDAWERDFQAAKPFLGEELLSEIARGTRYGRHGVVSPHQRISMGDILAWRQKRREVWKDGLIRLIALTREGQKLLEAGDLSCLVLPWIDKFFISSRREEDHEYLPSLVRWLERGGTDPLVMFWEDTAHSRAPSFGITLSRLAERGHRYRGIGIFDREGSNRREAPDLIYREHRRMRLFALRPQSDTHHFKPLQELLRTRDHDFIRSYDSSWKDELSFVYAGTQVSPLLSVQCDMEPFPAWIAVEHAKYPFGTCLRRRLREKVLKNTNEADDTLSRSYAFWANLG